MDLSTGKEGYYLYDKNNNTFQLFDEELFVSLAKDNDLFLYMFIGSLAVILVCIVIILVMLKKKNKGTKDTKKEDKKDIKRIEDKSEKDLSESRKLDLLFEDIDEPKKSKKRKKEE